MPFKQTFIHAFQAKTAPRNLATQLQTSLQLNTTLPIKCNLNANVTAA
jgi:hypothetical protein